MKRKATEGEEKTRQGWARKETSFQPVLAEERTTCVSLPRDRADLDPNLLLPFISSVTLGVSLHLLELFFLSL